MVEEEAQSIEGARTERTAQKEIAAPPAIEVFNQRAGSMEMGGERAGRPLGGMELVFKLSMKVCRPRPIRLSGGRKALKRKQCSHRGQRDAVLVGDGFQALFEAGGKAKHRVAFALEPSAQGANSMPIEAFKMCECVGDERVALGSAVGIEPIRCQDIVVKPVKQSLHVFREPDRERLLIPRLGQCGREPLTLFSRRGLAGVGAFFQWVGDLGKVSKGVKDIAFTRDIGPGERLAGTQPPGAIGQGIVRMQALRRSVQQMNDPGFRIAVARHGEQVAIERIEIEACQHRSARLEPLVVATGSSTG